MPQSVLTALVTCCLVSACTGNIVGGTIFPNQNPHPHFNPDPQNPNPQNPENPVDPQNPPDMPPMPCEVSSGRVVARRLSKTEYNNTVRDLFTFDTQKPADAFPDDVSGGDVLNNNGLIVSDQFLEKHETAATELARKAVANNIIQCNPQTISERLCARQTLEPFMRKAWRRPVTEDEVTRVLNYLNVVAAEPTETDKFRQAIRLGLLDILMSPNFLFRFEILERPTDVQAQTLSAYEVASRLSYFIYASIPDEPLRAAAESGALNDTAEIERQVARMLADPKSQSLVERLSSAWLWVDKVNAVNPKPSLYPSFNSAMRENFKTETGLFMREFLIGDKPFKDMFDADFTYVNGALRQHYGMQGNVAAANFERVTLETNSKRGGLFTHGSILAATSAPLNIPNAEIKETNVIVRGKFVLSQLVCADFETPAGIDFVGIQNTSQQNIPPNAPRKIRDAVRLAKAECASCHSHIDPIGYSMEAFDVIGASRTHDTFGAAVDSTGVLLADNGTPVGNFDGARSLGSLLKSDKRLTACLTKQVFKLAVGRPAAVAEQCRLDGVAKEAKQKGDRLKDLILGLTLNNSFTKQEGEAP
jgi:hypothetical protein